MRQRIARLREIERSYGTVSSMQRYVRTAGKMSVLYVIPRPHSLDHALTRYQAVIKYRAEGSASDKTTYYTQILAQQLSGDQKIEAATLKGVTDMSAQIQLSVALKQMKDAFERPAVRRFRFAAD
jgi:hypothetical protein